MNGKNRCRILKDIRKKIAEENGIEYITTECKYKGDCLGTCPKCESEVRFLEQELKRKRSLGQRIALAGIAAGITVSAVGCTPDTLSKLGIGDTAGEEQPLQGVPVESMASESLCSRPDDSKVSEIVDGEIVEVIGEVPDYSDCSDSKTMGEPSEYAEMGELLPDLPEISNPYDNAMGQVAEFSYDIKEIAEMEDEAAFEILRCWQRQYVEFHWQEYIVVRELEYTEFRVYTADTETDIYVYYGEDGYVSDLRIFHDEIALTGDIE